MKSDPYLQGLTPSDPPIIDIRAKTLKNKLAPSEFCNKTLGINPPSQKNKGSYKCPKTRCECCENIGDNVTTITSSNTKETIPLTSPLDCDCTFVVYLLSCTCGLQYVGRTIQTLQKWLNTHCANIKGVFLTHSVSKQAFTHHDQFSLVPIE